MVGCTIYCLVKLWLKLNVELLPIRDALICRFAGRSLRQGEVCRPPDRTVAGVVTDNDEAVQAGGGNSGDSKNRGFRLNFRQHPCT